MKRKLLAVFYFVQFIILRYSTNIENLSEILKSINDGLALVPSKLFQIKLHEKKQRDFAAKDLTLLGQ